MKQTPAHPKKNNSSHLPHPVHKIGLNNIPFSSFVFTTLFPVLAAQEECERERGEEGKLFIWGRRGPLSEGCDSDHNVRELQGLQLSGGSAWQTKYSSHLFS